jgi:LPS export ABC transporter protein LptC
LIASTPHKNKLSFFWPIVAGAFLLTTANCKNDPDTIRALTGKINRQEDRATGVTFLYSQDGRIKMRISAKEFVRNSVAKRPYVDMNNGLKMEFFDDSGEVSDILTADSSRYYEAQRDFIVWDSVQIVSKKGEKLNTDELIWNESVQKFFTEKPVVITTNNEILYGNGMEANRDFTWYKILNPKGSVQVDKGEVPK